MHSKVDLKDFKNKKIALVLSGGVVKASAWHLGVSLALDELGFTFKSNEYLGRGLPLKSNAYEISTYVGSSAGAIISLYLASGYRPMDIVDAYLNKNSEILRPISYSDMLYMKRPMKVSKRKTTYDPFEGFPLLIRQLLRPVSNITGLFSTHGLYKHLVDHVVKTDRFEDFAADFFVVATKLDDSQKVIFSKYNYPNPTHDSTAVYYTGYPISSAVAASMSVPPFYSPYPVKNIRTNQLEYYIDGEIRETLSNHVAVDNKCEFIISSWTHTPYHYQDEVGSLVHYGLPAICLQSIYLLVQKKIVTSRVQRLTAEDLISTISEYMKDNKFDEVHRKKITSIIERKLNYNPNIHFLDIYPKPDQYKIFFSSSFSLNHENTALLVTSGYRRTMEVFKYHEWEN